MESLPAGQARSTPSSSFQGDLPLWKRLFACSGMLALESYITYEEIYLTTTLQRMEVPYALLSLPGAVSGVLGVFVIPLLGWAMDRYRGSKRLFICGTLLLISVGMAVLLYTGSISLYHADSKMAYPHSETAFPNQTSAVDDGRNNGIGSETMSFNQTFAVDESSQNGTTSVLTMTGAIALAGFTIGNHGYDTSTLSVRTYVLSISPEAQHDSLLLTLTMMGAIGGCMTSLIGFLDLSGIFPNLAGHTLDKGNAQFLVQSAIFVVVLVLFCTSTVLSNSKLFERNTTSILDLFSRNQDQNKRTPFKEENGFSLHELETKHFAKSSRRNSNVYKSQEKRSGSERTRNTSESHGTLQNSNSTKHELNTDRQSEETEKVQHCRQEKVSSGCISRRAKSRLSLMIMAFLVIFAMASYFFFITNYVAEIIYKGNPHAPTGSHPYNQYVFGTRMASLSMLMFYVVFVIYNCLHGKILDKVGMKAEFVITSLSVTVLTVMVVLTENMVLVFVAMVPLAAYRSCCLTVPFILANKYAQQEHRELAERTSNNGVAADRTTTPPALANKTRREEHSDDGGVGDRGGGGGGVGDRGGGGRGDGEGDGGDGGGGGGSPGSGGAMASITVMLPLTYGLVCLVSGPVIALTANTALPVYVSIAAYGLGTLSAAVVDFGE